MYDPTKGIIVIGVLVPLFIQACVICQNVDTLGVVCVRGPRIIYSLPQLLDANQNNPSSRPLCQHLKVGSAVDSRKWVDIIYVKEQEALW